MAKQIRLVGRWFLLVGPLALLVFLLARPAQVQAASFSSSFWTNASSNLECACSASCSGCGGPSIWSPEGVNYLTGEFREVRTLLDVPGLVDSTVVAITNRSAVTGLGQVGNGWMLSFEYTVAKTIVNVGSPESNGGHYAIVRHPTGFFSLCS